MGNTIPSSSTRHVNLTAQSEGNLVGLPQITKSTSNNVVFTDSKIIADISTNGRFEITDALTGKPLLEVSGDPHMDIAVTDPVTGKTTMQRLGDLKEDMTFQFGDTKFRLAMTPGKNGTAWIGSITITSGPDYTATITGVAPDKIKGDAFILDESRGVGSSSGSKKDTELQKDSKLETTYIGTVDPNGSLRVMAKDLKTGQLVNVKGQGDIDALEGNQRLKQFKLDKQLAAVNGDAPLPTSKTLGGALQNLPPDVKKAVEDTGLNPNTPMPAPLSVQQTLQQAGVTLPPGKTLADAVTDLQQHPEQMKKVEDMLAHPDPAAQNGEVTEKELAGLSWSAAVMLILARKADSQGRQIKDKAQAYTKAPQETKEEAKVQLTEATQRMDSLVQLIKALNDLIKNVNRNLLPGQ